MNNITAVCLLFSIMGIGVIIGGICIIIEDRKKTGKWIKEQYTGKVTQDNNWTAYRCSNCTRLSRIKEKYCPECGAKMTEAEE